MTTKRANTKERDIILLGIGHFCSTGRVLLDVGLEPVGTSAVKLVGFRRCNVKRNKYQLSYRICDFLNVCSRPDLVIYLMLPLTVAPCRVISFPCRTQCEGLCGSTSRAGSAAPIQKQHEGQEQRYGLLHNAGRRKFRAIGRWWKIECKALRRSRGRRSLVTGSGFLYDLRSPRRLLLGGRVRLPVGACNTGRGRCHVLATNVCQRLSSLFAPPYASCIQLQ